MSHGHSYQKVWLVFYPSLSVFYEDHNKETFLRNLYSTEKLSHPILKAIFKYDKYSVIIAINNVTNGWKPLTIITKRSILDVAAALDPASDV